MNVIIGGASGIGAAVASVLPGDTLVADLVGTDVRCDITDPASVASLVERVDRLDVVVITAGVSPSQADAERILDVDLVGVARTLAAFEPLVVPGVVAVCVASMAGHLLVPDDAQLAVLADPFDRASLMRLTDDPSMAYVLAKHGVIRLVRRLAPSWGARGARIVSVSPGVIDTPMTTITQNEAATRALMDRLPARRLGTAEDVAAACLFLAGEAAGYISGAVLPVDGGLLAY